MRVALYARVSTDGQSVNSQLVDLRDVAKRQGWEIVAEFVDKGISGSKGRDQRPGLDKMLKAAMRGEFDLVAAWSVDRLGRSLRHLVSNLEELHGAKVDLFLHQQGLNTSTPTGRAMYQMLGVFAEFERSIIVARVRNGVAHAQKHGTRSGRPIGRPKVGAKVEKEVRKLRAEGLGIRKIAKRLKLGTGTVQRIVHE